jgi:hypothetical protein
MSLTLVTVKNLYCWFLRMILPVEAARGDDGKSRCMKIHSPVVDRLRSATARESWLLCRNTTVTVSNLGRMWKLGRNEFEGHPQEHPWSRDGVTTARVTREIPGAGEEDRDTVQLARQLEHFLES